ncbi:MAG: DUF1415 domain-containing protein [Gammaproteobacteria bacterium]|nr:DUF1415 domain-containing protein [Gammaproteobacteria bacterium]
MTFWLENSVIGLGLCPFARQVWEGQKVRLAISDSDEHEGLLLDLYNECEHLVHNQAVETTLLVIPNSLIDFDDFNQFLDLCDTLLSQFNWNGEFQIASFHPKYQFSGTQADDRENWTNRSPYPLLHLLREESLSKALASHPCPETIPVSNIETLNSLSEREFRRIFGDNNN